MDSSTLKNSDPRKQPKDDADLLDANETNWAFIAAYSVGCSANLPVSPLATFGLVGG